MEDGEKARVVLNCRGPFSLLRADGTDITPRNMKTCGLLALLALSQGNRRARRWLETKLWSDRDQAQANGSLRQALSELRKCLGCDKEGLVSDRRFVALDARVIAIDLGQGDAMRLPLFEGLDVRDPEFESWLAQERQRTDAKPAALTDSAHLIEALAPRPQAPQATRVGIRHDGFEMCRTVVHMAAQNLSELGGFDIVDIDAPGTAADLMLDVAALRDDRTTHLMLGVTDRAGAVVWTTSRLFNGLGLNDALSAGNEATEALLRAARALEGSDPAMRMRERAIDELFTFDAARLRVADGLLTAVHDQTSDPIALAWLAFLRLVMVNERTETDLDTLRDEARAFACQAAERDGRNPSMIALIGQIELFLGGVIEDVDDLIRSASQRNASSVMARTALTTLAMRQGDVRMAQNLSRAAVQLAGESRYAQWAHMVACLTDISVGDFDRATRNAARALRLAPAFRMPMRHLYALDVHAKRHDRARKLLGDLQRQTPGFSLQMIRQTPEFPAATLRASPLAHNRDVGPG
ncbi:hypothetical protein [Pseudooctadecabacter sp.]|uniref:AfsR/SARP family transcriptional regulator n=1 Tax=Pseudooctadecabacter sp. TaxID=1966338 RepID=UPI0035C7D441